MMTDREEYLVWTDQCEFHIARLGVVSCLPGNTPEIGWFGRDDGMICSNDSVTAAVRLSEHDPRLARAMFGEER